MKHVELNSEHNGQKSEEDWNFCDILFQYITRQGR